MQIIKVGFSKTYLTCYILLITQIKDVLLINSQKKAVSMSLSSVDRLSIKYIFLINPHLKRSCSHRSQNWAIFEGSLHYTTPIICWWQHSNASVSCDRSHSWQWQIWASMFEEQNLHASGMFYLHRWLALGTRKLFGQASWHPHPLLQHKMSHSDLRGSHCDTQWYPLQTTSDMEN